MTEVVTEENDDFLLSEIDWDALLQSLPQDPLDFLPDPSPEDPTHPISVPSSISSTSDKFLEIEQDKFVEIEQFLLEDGNEIGDSRDGYGDFFSDLLIDLSDSHSADTTLSCAGIPTPESHGDQEEKESEEKEKSDDSDVMNGQEDDPISKKRKRQMRNRDSAMKSRERKKEYVRDLETKSKFLEGECRRLDYALRCCVADNQFLQQQLQLKQEASGASLPKQESAVLPLESLPLGSLFWLMLCIVCHFLLPATVLAVLMGKVVNLRLNKSSCATAEAVRRAGPAAVAGGNKEAIAGSALGLSFKRRRWKAMKWKMRLVSHLLAVFVC